LFLSAFFGFGFFALGRPLEGKKYVLKGVEGTIKITTPDGKTRIAKEGDVVMDGDIIDGSDGGTAEISQEGSSTHDLIGSKTLMQLGGEKEGFDHTYTWGGIAAPYDAAAEGDNASVFDTMKVIIFGGGPNNASNIVDTIKDDVDYAVNGRPDPNAGKYDRKIVVHDPQGQIYIRHADGSLQEAKDGDEVGSEDRLISLDDSWVNVTFKYTDDNGTTIESKQWEMSPNSCMEGAGIEGMENSCAAAVGVR
jgi:hypothetical protein